MSEFLYSFDLIPWFPAVFVIFILFSVLLIPYQRKRNYYLWICAFEITIWLNSVEPDVISRNSICFAGRVNVGCVDGYNSVLIWLILKAWWWWAKIMHSVLTRNYVANGLWIGFNSSNSIPNLPLNTRVST